MLIQQLWPLHINSRTSSDVSGNTTPVVVNQTEQSTVASYESNNSQVMYLLEIIQERILNNRAEVITEVITEVIIIMIHQETTYIK